MRVTISDEDWATIRDSVLSTAEIKDFSQIVESIKRERAAADVVRRIEAERRNT